MNAIFFQSLGSDNLDRDNSLGITRAPAIDLVLVFRRRNKWRHGVHVGREYDCRIRRAWRCRPHVGALTFDEHAPRFVAEPAQSLLEEMANGCLVSGDGLDVHELAGEGDDVHVEREYQRGLNSELRMQK